MPATSGHAVVTGGSSGIGTAVVTRLAAASQRAPGSPAPAVVAIVTGQCLAVDRGWTAVGK